MICSGVVGTDFDVAEPFNFRVAFLIRTAPPCSTARSVECVSHVGIFFAPDLGVFEPGSVMAWLPEWAALKLLPRQGAAGTDTGDGPPWGAPPPLSDPPATQPCTVKPELLFPEDGGFDDIA